MTERNEIEQVVIDAGGAAFQPRLWQKAGKNRIYLQSGWKKGCTLFIDLDATPIRGCCYIEIDQDPRWIVAQKNKFLAMIEPLVAAVQAFLDGRKPIEIGEEPMHISPSMN